MQKMHPYLRVLSFCMFRLYRFYKSMKITTETRLCITSVNNKGDILVKGLNAEKVNV